MADWDWDETSPKSKGDWLIIYYPGKRAITEIKEAQTFFKSPPLEVEALPEPELKEPAKTKRKQTPVESRNSGKIEAEATLSPMTQELVNRGITKAVALDFEENFPEEHIREKIQLHDYKKERGEITTNAAGWLREAIVRDYKPSEQQLKKKAQVEQRKAQQEELRTVEEKAREIQEQQLLEALQPFPEAEQWVRERVVEHVNVRQMTIKAFGGEQFSAAEIEAMYVDFQAQVPKTLEEKRAWLISNYKEYALSTIISELREDRARGKTKSSVAFCTSGLLEEQQQSLKESEVPPSGTQQQADFNSIEAALGEVARQRAEFEATQKRSENAAEPEAEEDDD